MKTWFRAWMKNPSLQLATHFVLVAGFSAILGILSFSENLERVLTLWGENNQMSLYLSEEATEESIKNLESTLQKNNLIEKIKFLSKEEALNEFRTQMQSYAPDLLEDNSLMNAIPSSFQFSIASSIPAAEHLSTLQKLAQSLSLEPIVEDVSYGQEWVKSYSSLTNGISSIGLSMVMLVLICAGFVIGNTIQNSIRQRRREIEILELVGASRWYIRKPFFEEVMTTTVVSFGIAGIMTFLGFNWLQNLMATKLSLLQLAHHLSFLSVERFMTALAVVGLLALGAAYLSLHSLNDGWSASQRRKSF